MKYRLLGNSGLEVSEIGFGCMTFTGPDGWRHVGSSGRQEAAELVALALDQGVNFFDTADVYSNGTSEEILGKALDARRPEAVIATKCGLPLQAGPNRDGLSRRRILAACEASLQRLGSDYIDLYQVHAYDFWTPLEETLSTLNDLVRQGKVRYVGVSNFSAGQLMKAQNLCNRQGWEPLISLQAYYSLMGRDLELDLVPVCRDQGLGVLVWGPLHGGFLSGKYGPDRPWPQSTRLKQPADMRPGELERGYEIIEVLSDIAGEQQITVVQAALNYLLQKPAVASVIIGATGREQLLENLAAGDRDLSAPQVARLDAVSEPRRYYPHWYFDLYRADRRKPVQGRL